MKSSPLLRSALAAALCALSLPALAQFNGPPVSSNGELNRSTAPTTNSEVLFPAERDLVLSPEDLLVVRVFGEADYAPTVRIGNDGTAQLPLIGLVHLAGLTVPAAEKLVAEKLISAGMFTDPQVTIQVTAGPNSAVTVVGEAHGVIPVTGQRRLFDVLAAAGGLPPTASHVITINRPGVAQPIVVDLGTNPSRSALADIPVFAGDTIVVSKVGVVYVIGAFKTQGAIPLVQNQPLTLLEATALSGGTAFEAKYTDLRIIRTVGDQRTVVKLDIKKVLYGQAPDPILEPNDILFLPSSALKAALSNGTVGTFVSVANILTTILLYR